MDPEFTSDGAPYGPERYKDIVHECYLVSKYCHTSYTDLLSVTPLEREYLLSFITEEKEKEKELKEQQMRELNSRNKNGRQQF